MGILNQKEQVLHVELQLIYGMRHMPTQICISKMLHIPILNWHMHTLRFPHTCRMNIYGLDEVRIVY